jgi:hypothetical protein
MAVEQRPFHVNIAEAKGNQQDLQFFGRCGEGEEES